MTKQKKKEVVVLGAGVTGLSSAFFARQNNLDCLVVEKDQYAGGLAKTIHYKDFKFDLGGHRFVTHHSKLYRFVTRLLNDDYVTVKRSSKIYLNNRYINYPLEPINAFFHTGIKNTFHIISDYLKQKVLNINQSANPKSLEDWIVSHYGRRLYHLFFKTYSEKVWGIDCSKIDKEWIIQRIQGLSLGQALKRAMFQSKSKGKFKTLADEFLYPTNGIGDIIDGLCDGIDKNSMSLNSEIISINHRSNKIESIDMVHAGKQINVSAKQCINTIPITRFVRLLNPEPPDEIKQAIDKLRSRDLVVVTLFINKPQVTMDNWIYFPDKSVPFGRIHEPPNWSAAMSPSGKTSIVAEFFCFHDDPIWQSSDEDIVSKTVAALQDMQLITQDELIDSKVIRIRHAYPLFELDFNDHCKIVCQYLDGFENLSLAGRSGMFRYYNLDQAMLSGIDAVCSLLPNKDSSIDSLLTEYLTTDRGRNNEVRTDNTSMAT